MAKKIHTRQKKLLIPIKGHKRTKRPKSFSSQEKAKEWAEKAGIKKYEVIQLRQGLSHKFRVVEKL